MLSKVFRCGDKVFVKKDSSGKEVRQDGIVVDLRRESGNGQTVTVEIAPNTTVTTHNDSDHLEWE